MLDVSRIRQDFPILNRRVYGKRLVYFDNAATSQRPVQVIEAIRRFYSEYNANVHRGFHWLSQEASRLYEDAHEEVAKFIGAEWDEVAFLRNTTEALNLVATTLAGSLVGRGDRVLVTLMDHHSNMLPWLTLSRRLGFRVDFVDITEEGYLDYADLESKLAKDVKVVAVPHASNVVGTINDVRRVAKLAHEYGALVVIDGAQSVPHIPVDVKELDADFLAFSGHKMLGPMGIGVLYYRKEAVRDLEPGMSGGGTIKTVPCSEDYRLCSPRWGDLPWKFEAGTPNVAGALGLVEAVRYLSRIGMTNVMEHERSLVRRMMDGLMGLGGIRILGPLKPEDRTGLVSFVVKGYHHDAVAAGLDVMGVAVRSGLHCAHPLHQRLGIEGSVRASFYIYNTLEEVDYFLECLGSILGRQT